MTKYFGILEFNLWIHSKSLTKHAGPFKYNLWTLGAKKTQLAEQRAQPITLRIFIKYHKDNGLLPIVSHSVHFLSPIQRLESSSTGKKFSYPTMSLLLCADVFVAPADARRSTNWRSRMRYPHSRPLPPRHQFKRVGRWSDEMKDKPEKKKHWEIVRGRRENWFGVILKDIPRLHGKCLEEMINRGREMKR